MDAANIRAEYAELAAAVLTGDYNATNDAEKYVVTLKQKEDNWSATFDFAENIKQSGNPSAGGKATLTYDSTTNVFTVTYSSANEG